MRDFDPMTTAISAIRNASTVSVTSDDVLVALRAGHGESSHLRALFGDVAFETVSATASATTRSDGHIFSRVNVLPPETPSSWRAEAVPIRVRACPKC